MFDQLWNEARTEIESRLNVPLGLPMGPEALGQLLQTVRPSVLPLRLAPIVRVDGNLALVDFQAAAHALETALDFVSDHGAVSNARAAHFEAEIGRAHV